MKDYIIVVDNKIQAHGLKRAEAKKLGMEMRRNGTAAFMFKLTDWMKFNTHFL